jgi:hypothetical protein
VRARSGRPQKRPGQDLRRDGAADPLLKTWDAVAGS